MVPLPRCFRATHKHSKRLHGCTLQGLHTPVPGFTQRACLTALNTGMLIDLAAHQLPTRSNVASAVHHQPCQEAALSGNACWARQLQHTQQDRSRAWVVPRGLQCIAFTPLGGAK
jgi:hypothetical protein